MSLLGWLQNLRSTLVPGRGRRRQRRTGFPRAATHRPNLEILEDRCLLSFSPAVSYPVGEYAAALVAADFNNDGRLDLATASGSVLLGNGDGSFQPALNSATGYGPRSLAVGDFNADGNLDLATANAYDASVLLGNGDGTFQAPASVFFKDGEYPQAVAVGDFNGDGLLDLGVTSNIPYDSYSGLQYQSYANVLLGHGDGSFSGPNSTGLDYRNNSAAVAADINGDAFDDFVTITSGWSSRVSVLLGQSSGDLRASSGFVGGELSASVAAGDLNADGDTDLVTGNEYGGIVGGTIGVSLGDGTSAFSPVIYHAATWYPTALALGDFTGDGHVDVATSNELMVLAGAGDGTFSPWGTFAVGSNPNGLAAGDFNGDGWLDIATASVDDVSVLINDRSWPAPLPPSIYVSDMTVMEPDTGTLLVAGNVTLSYASNVDVTFHYASADISATAGSDYVAVSGDVTIRAGQTLGGFGVWVKSDGVAEPTETFAINLSAPRNATLADAQVIGTILGAPLQVSINEVTVKEGNTGRVDATFTVKLSYTSDTAITVHYTTANNTATAGSDYTAASGDVTFAPGETTKTITIAVSGDRTFESDESFFVNLSSSDASVSSHGRATIMDDEPRISISDATKREGRKNTTLFTFTVTLSAAYDEPVTVSFQTVNGTATTGDNDYIARTGTLTFAPGATTKTITIEIKGDSKKETNETFYLDLFYSSSNALFTKNRGLGTILNDD